MALASTLMPYDPANFLYLSREDDVQLTLKQEQINRWAVRTRSEVGKYYYDANLFSLEFSTPDHALRFRDAWFPHLPDPTRLGALLIDPDRYYEINQSALIEWRDGLDPNDRPFYHGTIRIEHQMFIRVLFRTKEAATMFKLRWL